MADQQLQKIQNELKVFINAEDVQKKIIALLQEHDALRFREKIQSEIDKLLLGEYSRWALSRRIHTSTGLPIEKTDKIMFALFDTIFKPKLDFIQQVFNQAYNKEPQKIPKEQKDSTSYQLKPLNLKDIFEETAEGLSGKEIQIPEFEKDSQRFKKANKEQEDSALAEIIGKIKLPLTESQKKRMADIFRSRLKNIRDAVDTRLALSREESSGGMGLSDSDASDLSLSIEEYIRTKWPPKSATGEKGAETEVTPGAVRFPEEMLKQTSVTGDPESQPPATIQEQTPQAMKNILTKKENAISTPISESTSAKTPAEPQTIPMQQTPVPPPVNSDLYTDVPVSDVKKSTIPLHLVGPIGELQEMTIEDWRRLYKNANNAKKQIQEKIERLGRDSFKKKLEGIKAWQRGAIMQLYLLMGKISMENKNTIETIGSELKAQNKQYLTDQEFHAIMDLNKILRMY